MALVAEQRFERMLERMRRRWPGLANYTGHPLTHHVVVRYRVPLAVGILGPVAGLLSMLMVYHIVKAAAIGAARPPWWLLVHIFLIFGISLFMVNQTTKPNLYLPTRFFAGNMKGARQDLWLSGLRFGEIAGITAAFTYCRQGVWLGWLRYGLWLPLVLGGIWIVNRIPFGNSTMHLHAAAAVGVLVSVLWFFITSLEPIIYLNMRMIYNGLQERLLETTSSQPAARLRRIVLLFLLLLPLHLLILYLFSSWATPMQRILSVYGLAAGLLLWQVKLRHGGLEKSLLKMVEKGEPQYVRLIQIEAERTDG